MNANGAAFAEGSIAGLETETKVNVRGGKEDLAREKNKKMEMIKY